MLFEEVLYAGIDPASGRAKPSLAVVDRDLRIVSLERGLENILESLSAMNARAAAVTTPQSPSLGLMARPYVRYLYQLNPESSQFSKLRVSEYELRRHSLRIRSAPLQNRKPSAVVERGFLFYKRLQELGYTPYNREEGPGQRVFMEVPERAAYAVLLQVRPYRAASLEGRLQRQLALYMEGVDLPNPMLVLEEVTRHRLLTGSLNLKDLLEPSMLAALAAACTACLAGEQEKKVCQVGDAEDGLITLPVSDLLPSYG